MNTSKKIRRDILVLLEKSKQPVSTREIAMRINRAWHSAQLNCLKLQIEGKLDCMRIGNINAWVMKRE